VAAPASACQGQAYNIAGDASYALLDLLEILGRLLDVVPDPVHTDPRRGDIRNSRAQVDAARAHLGYEATVGFDEGLRRAVAWFESREPRGG
jgi:UDP-glucose 4-epimerase